MSSLIVAVSSLIVADVLLPQKLRAAIECTMCSNHCSARLGLPAGHLTSSHYLVGSCGQPSILACMYRTA